MKILHILEDEKVVNSFIQMMESVYPRENSYLIVCNGDTPQRVTLNENITALKRNSRTYCQLLKNLTSYRHICIHSLSGCSNYHLINHPSVSWIIWGADLYESLLRFEGYQLYEDPELMYKIRAQKKPVFLYKLATYIRDYIQYYNEKRIIKKVKYIITDNESDYRVFKKYYPTSNIVHLGSINYYPIERLVGDDNIDKTCTGNAIWVGNSAAPNGNHIGIFKILSGFNNNARVYCPLSYGDKRLARYIEDAGRRLLGGSLYSLTDFLPVQQYYSIFLNCNSFVFGHYRQCAVGNILMAFYFGGKVFLYKRNPLFQTYKEMGFVVFSIDDELNADFCISPLSLQERNNNKTLVLKLASYESSLEQIRKVFENI